MERSELRAAQVASIATADNSMLEPPGSDLPRFLHKREVLGSASQLSPGAAVTFQLKDHNGATQAAQVRQCPLPAFPLPSSRRQCLDLAALQVRLDGSAEPRGTSRPGGGGGGGKGGGRSVYAEYLPRRELSEGLKAGELFQGGVRLVGAIGFVAVDGTPPPHTHTPLAAQPKR